MRPNPYPEANTSFERFIWQLVDRIQTGDSSPGELLRLARFVAAVGTMRFAGQQDQQATARWSATCEFFDLLAPVAAPAKTRTPAGVTR